MLFSPGTGPHQLSGSLGLPLEWPDMLELLAASPGKVHAPGGCCLGSGPLNALSWHHINPPTNRWKFFFGKVQDSIMVVEGFFDEEDAEH